MSLSSPYGCSGCDGNRVPHACHGRMHASSMGWVWRGGSNVYMGTKHIKTQPCSPEIATDVEALVVAVEHVYSAAILARLLVQVPQELNNGCSRTCMHLATLPGWRHGLLYSVQ